MLVALHTRLEGHLLGRSRRPTAFVVLLLALLGWAGLARVAAAAPEQPLSPEMRAIEVTDHRGERIDTGLRFTDEHGNPVVLADFFDGERPVALTLNYYRCRVVCSVQLEGLADALAQVDWKAGDDFRLVTLSIDPRETAVEAADKRGKVLDVVGKGSDMPWTFLTGEELQIRALAAQLGISYAYDAEQDQYAHPGVVVFLTPDGRVSRYVYGLSYDPLDVKLGLYEAADGKIGGPVEQIYLSCFSYDATIGRYGPFAMGIMRVGGTFTVLVLGTVLFFLWRRERRQAVRVEGPSAPSGDDLERAAKVGPSAPSGDDLERAAKVGPSAPSGDDDDLERAAKFEPRGGTAAPGGVEAV